MANAFSRTITLLRKENGLSQKQAAESLFISQALLSHYEKGIRECGLEFLIKVADFYGVTCDFLLGRTTERGKKGITESDFTKGTDSTENNADLLKHKRQIFNCLSIIYDMTSRFQNRQISSEVCTILSLNIYHIFRLFGTVNLTENSEIFGSPVVKTLFLINGQIQMQNGKLFELLKGDDLPKAELQKLKKANSFLPEQLEALYPLYAKSFSSLVEERQKKLYK